MNELKIITNNMVGGLMNKCSGRFYQHTYRIVAISIYTLLNNMRQGL